jgi:Putative prokaryotic signal transducing protein
MITVRTFGNLAEAGFAKSLLESAGIRAELADEHTYTLGYGPGTGSLRLQVDEADLESAIQVLKEGPDADIPRPVEAPPPSVGEARTPRFPAGIFIAAAVLFAAILFAVSQLREKRLATDSTTLTYEIDYENDGRPDQITYYRGNLPWKATTDRNRDGKPDEWLEYDGRGHYLSASFDQNFDGNADGWSQFKNGNLLTSQLDTDFNGTPDLFSEFENGVGVRIEYRPNNSARVTRVEKYTNGVFSEEFADSDGDGKFDYRIKHDAFGNASERLPIVSGK